MLIMQDLGYFRTKSQPDVFSARSGVLFQFKKKTSSSYREYPQLLTILFVNSESQMVFESFPRLHTYMNPNF